MPWFTLRLQLADRVYMMKKTLIYIIKLILPTLLILSLMYLLRGGKNILEGLYILFPIIFVLQGVFCSDSLVLFFAGALLSEAVFLIFVNVLYEMGSCIDLAIIYAVICAAAYLIKQFSIKLMNKKSHK